MNKSDHESKPQSEFSFSRLMLTLVAVGVVAGAAYWYGINSVKPLDGSTTMTILGLGRPVHNKLSDQFQDADGDLVADPPTDESQWIDPEVLTFSYLPASGQERYGQVWADFLDHLSKQTGKPTKYITLHSAEEQLLALKNGTLHVTGFNPGTVPVAVNTCGFVPVCGFGRDGKPATYTMAIVASDSSQAKNIDDLSGQTLALTYPTSNSGCKAPLMILKNEFQLLPARDYTVLFSNSHENSLHGIASGFYEFAAVASEEVALAIKHGTIAEDQFHTLYESEPFPSNAVGHSYNLQPELAKKVSAAILSYPWEDSELAGEFAHINVNQFVPIDYKDHFQLIRQIDDTVGRRHEVGSGASIPETTP